MHIEMGHLSNFAILLVLFGQIYMDDQSTWPQISGRPSCQVGHKDNSSTRINTTERLKQLRDLMKTSGFEAYIIPDGDEHASEWPAGYSRRRCYISGLCGSAGTAVVTMTEAAVWTDGRYLIEGEQSLDCNWILMNVMKPSDPTQIEWLGSKLKPGDNVGGNARTITYDNWEYMSENLENTKINLTKANIGLVDAVWDNETSPKRPEVPAGHIVIHSLEYAGKSWTDKIKEVRAEMRRRKADAMIVTRLDEISWLFNLRGKDIPYHPMFLAYSIITSTTLKLFIRDKNTKVKQEDLRKHLKTNINGSCHGIDGDCVEMKSYDKDLENDVKKITTDSNKVWIDGMTNYNIAEMIPKNKRLVLNSPIGLMKAVKNEVERKAMFKANLKDSVAFITQIALIEKEVKENIEWTELKAAKKLADIRQKQEGNHGESFETIAASGSNGAIMHYRTTKATNKRITTKEMYLQDAGGQYLDGTTDTTRTFHFGKPTEHEIDAYTRVLCGAIDLARLKWPNNRMGIHVDAIARKSLWQKGLDYQHGTGHGIGQYLSVHEGTPRLSSGDHDLLEGMFLSNEPGYYEANKFGIRLETVVMVEKSNYTFQKIPFLQFKPACLVPFEPHLIKYSYLNDAQLEWLNRYHKQVEDVVGAELKRLGLTKELAWVKRRTVQVTRSGVAHVSGSYAVAVVMVIFVMAACE